MDARCQRSAAGTALYGCQRRGARDLATGTRMAGLQVQRSGSLVEGHSNSVRGRALRWVLADGPPGGSFSHRLLRPERPAYLKQPGAWLHHLRQLLLLDAGPDLGEPPVSVVRDDPGRYAGRLS